MLATLSVPYLARRSSQRSAIRERMFEMLELALKTDSGGLQNLVGAPEFERYRQDPRFIDFAARAGFPMPIRDPRFSAGTLPVRAAR